jgi:hypothetical protein
MSNKRKTPPGKYDIYELMGLSGVLELAHNQGVPIMLCMVIPPPDEDGFTDLPCLQWIKNLGVESQDLLTSVANEEWTSIHVEHWLADLRLFYRNYQHALQRSGQG